MLTVVGLLFALGGCTLWNIHRTWFRGPPDVAAFAHSDATRTADAAVARADSGLLAKLSSALPWSIPLGTSVADSCTTRDQNPFIGPRNWAPVSCTRSSVAYLAFDGDIHTRLRQLDTALQGQRWSVPLSDTGQRGALTALATELGEPGGDPVSGTPGAGQPPPGSTASPAEPGLSLSVHYQLEPVPRSPAAEAAAPRLGVAVVERPAVPLADTGDLQSDGPPEKASTDGAVYLAWHPLSTVAVTRAAQVTHRYVVAFSLVSRYAAQPVPTTPPPAPPTGNGVPPCYSGSHCG